MAVLYTAKQIQDVLKTLRIKPVDGMISTQEAARILTWRAEAERGIQHDYPESAVRRHIQSGNLKAYPVNSRYNMYKVEDVFDLPLVPKRGLSQRKSLDENTAKRKAIKPAA